MKKPTLPVQPPNNEDYLYRPQEIERVYVYQTKNEVQKFIDKHPDMDREDLSNLMYDKIHVSVDFYKDNGAPAYEVVDDAEGASDITDAKPISLSEILNGIPKHITLDRVRVETFSSDEPSEYHTAGIKVYYEVKNPDYKGQMKKWKAGQKKSNNQWHKYQKDKDVYEKELTKYNEWREDKIKKLEENGEL